MAMLEVRDLRKSFYTYAKPGLQAGIFHKPGARKVVSQLDVLKGVDLTVNKGDVVAILGPSGSGKTTFLRCLNFLETTDSGTLIFDGEQFDLGKITKADIARLRKKTAFVFQNYNLFRNKTALQNVTEGLIVARRMPREQADAIGRRMLEKVGLADRADYYPRQLSGGQQQRVGVARALAANPEVLLMDEPFGALDPVTREALQQEMIRIHRLLGRTIVLVTHDIDEALRLADHLVLMDGGEVIQQGAPLQMLLEPENTFVETFFGRSELGVRLLSLRGVGDYLRRNERLAGDTLNVAMTLREALSQFIAHRCDVLPVVDEQGEACGTLHFADLLGEEVRHARTS